MRRATKRLGAVLVGLLFLSANHAGWAAPPAPPTVKLVSAGSGGSQLRYKPSKGAECTVTMLTKSSSSSSYGDTQMPAQPMPGIKYTIHTVVKDVSPEGDASVEFNYTDADVTEEPGVPKETIDMMRTGIKSMKGMKGTMVISNRGMVKSVKMDVPANADPSTKMQMEGMEQSMNQFVVPLPEEAVGTGGKWTVEYKTEQGGMKMNTVNTVTLKNVSGDSFDVDIQIAQDAPEQDLASPGAPEGTPKTHVKLMKSTGKGTCTYLLNAVATKSCDLTTTSDSSMSMDAGGTPMEMKSHTESTVKMSQAK